MQKISVIIPVYIPDKSALNTVGRCLLSLQRTTKATTEIIIVDDDSPIKFYPDLGIKVVQHKKNTGFTRSVNDGIKKSTNHYFVVANQDVEFVDGWDERVIKRLKDVTVGVFSFPTTDEEIYLTGGVVENANFGSFWASRKDVVDQVGYLDENLKHYFSDQDYKQRVLASNFRVLKDTSLVLPHIGGSAYKKRENYMDLYFEDMERYEKKHGKID